MESNSPMEPFLMNVQRELDHQATIGAEYARAEQAARGIALSGRGGAHTMALDPSSVHVNQPLENVLVYYKNRKMIAPEVMPKVPVPKQSNVYYELASDTAFDTAKIDVAGQLGQVAEVSLSFKNTSTYFAMPRALREWVPLETEANADAVVQPLARSEENLADYLSLAYEIRVAGKAFLNTNYGSNHSALGGGARWDTSTGTPISDLTTAMELVVVNDELEIVFGGQVWPKFRTNTEVKSFITGRPSTELGATPLIMDEQTVAKALGIRKVLVGAAKNNSANDPETSSLGYVWGKSCALINVPERPGMKTAGFGYTFEWRPFKHRVYLDQTRGVEGAYMIQVSHAQDEKVIDPNGLTGYLYENVIS